MPIHRTSDWSQALVRVSKHPTNKEAWNPPKGRAETAQDLEHGSNFVYVPKHCAVQVMFGFYKTVHKLGVFGQTLADKKLVYFEQMKKVVPALDPGGLANDLWECVERFDLSDDFALFPGKGPEETFWLQRFV